MANNNLDDFTKMNETISDTLCNQLIDELEEVSSLIYYNLLNTDTYLDKEGLIEFICGDYFDNFLESNKPDSLDGVIEKFKSDGAFGKEVLEVYIDKYFPDDLVIYRFNGLFLSFAEDLDREQEDVPEIVCKIIASSSYFNDYQKRLVLSHIFNKCYDDLSVEKFCLEEDVENLIDDLEEYKNSTLSILDNEDLFLEMMQYYFNSRILSDFQHKRFEELCLTIIANYDEMPSNEKIEELYDRLIELNEKDNYLDVINCIIGGAEEEKIRTMEDLFSEMFSDDNEECTQFIENREYGVDILKRYLVALVLDLDEEKVITLNELAREVLVSLIDPNDTLEANTSTIEFYFYNDSFMQQYYEKHYGKYNLDLGCMRIFQKSLLMSDYYNANFGSVNDNDGDNINLIRNSSRREVFTNFDSNRYFRISCIESFISRMSNTDEKQDDECLCSDTATLEKVNLLYGLDRLNNKAYQKRIK